MNIQDFFDLPEEERQYLADMHYRQKRIRETSEEIKQGYAKLQTRYINNQISCEHPNAKKHSVRLEDEWGKLTRDYSHEYYCPDCDKKWYE